MITKRLLATAASAHRTSVIIQIARPTCVRVAAAAAAQHTLRSISSTPTSTATKRDPPSGPLPTDPLAPPPKPEVPPSPPIESGGTSAILSDDYNTKAPRWETPKVPDARLSPYASMAETFPRMCAVAKKLMPKAFMLKLRPALVNDEGTVVLFPDEVQHPKFVAPKSGGSMYCALHPDAIQTLAKRKGPHIWNMVRLDPSATIPTNLQEMVADMLGKRVVQELELARRVILAMPKTHASSPFFRPLLPAQAEALKKDVLPTYPDGKVIAVIDTNLRDPLPATLLATESDPDVPVFPLKLATHAPEAAAHLRTIVALERRRAVSVNVAGADAQVHADVEARAKAEGVSDYVAGTETIADLHGKLPEPEIDATVDGVESHRADEEAEFVAVVVPNDHFPDNFRPLAVPLVVALLRVALFNGIGWVEEPKVAKE